MLAYLRHAVELGSQGAQKQLVDAFTEDSPFIAELPMQAASHGIHHKYRKIVGINGDVSATGKINYENDFDSLPPNADAQISVHSVDLFRLATIVRVPHDLADLHGRERIFEEQATALIRQMGNALERTFFDRLIDESLKQGKCYADVITPQVDTEYPAITVVSPAEGECSGLYCSEFSGRQGLFDIIPLSGGQPFIDSSTLTSQRLVYASEIRAAVGLLLANPRRFSALVNIDAANITPLNFARKIAAVVDSARPNPQTLIVMPRQLQTALMTAFGQFGQSNALMSVDANQGLRICGCRVIASPNLDMNYGAFAGLQAP
ncbi:MAG: hypothetical protein LBH00_03785 [Planctomycetaceae bacterium]|nr:hypothetical protein [Planctomycetaceae bacterium]